MGVRFYVLFDYPNTPPPTLVRIIDVPLYAEVMGPCSKHGITIVLFSIKQIYEKLHVQLMHHIFGHEHLYRHTTGSQNELTQ